jgi:hypothetical protein
LESCTVGFRGVEVIGQASDQVEFPRPEACLIPVDEQPAGGVAEKVLAVHVGVHQPYAQRELGGGEGIGTACV